MQPVQVNLGSASASQEHGPSLWTMMQPMSESVDLANESNLSLGDIGRAASNVWSMFKKSVPWLVGAFGVYKIWQVFQNRGAAKSPEEAAAAIFSRRPVSRKPFSVDESSSGPIVGLRNAAMGIVGAAASAIQDPEKQKPSDPFPLRLLKTVTRFAGPGVGGALALEEAGPDVIRGSRLMARGDLVHAAGAFARGYIKTAATMSVAQAGERAGAWAFGSFPGGKPVGRWLGWILGSALGERLGNGAVAAMEKIASSLETEASSAGRSPEAIGPKISESGRRKTVAPPEVRAAGPTVAEPGADSVSPPRSFDRSRAR